jgi:hypothetical protein
MRDGKEVASRQIPGNGNGFCIEISRSNQADGRSSLAGLRVEAVRAHFRGKLLLRNRPFARIEGTYMTKVVVA